MYIFILFIFRSPSVHIVHDLSPTAALLRTEHIRGCLFVGSSTKFPIETPLRSFDSRQKHYQSTQVTMMKLQHTDMRRTLLLVTLMSVMWAVASAKPGDSRTFSSSTSSRRVRGVRGAKSTKKIEHGRRAAKKGGSSSSSSYTGCLNYNSTELEEMWIFEGSAPDCSYVDHGGSSGNGDDSYGTDDG
jgi:hypothetical protein